MLFLNESVPTTWPDVAMYGLGMVCFVAMMYFLTKSQ